MSTNSQQPLDPKQLDATALLEVVEQRSAQQYQTMLHEIAVLTAYASNLERRLAELQTDPA